MFNYELKKKILFFTGGTALRDIASEFSILDNLIMINIITVFDSGGSSALIRKEFNILAIGDIRNRLISLIIKNHNEDICNLLKYRFENTEENIKLQIELNKLIDLSHPLIKNIKEKYKIFFAKSLKNFNDKKSKQFKLKNGSIGNFIIVGDYLKTRNIYQTIKNIKELFSIKDEIIPISDVPSDIIAILENNQKIIGQHKITAKETPFLKSDIKRIYLQNQNISINNNIYKIIKNSDLIIYPIGSFYTSLISNFLVKEVNLSIKENCSPKVYIPNTFFDPELNNRPLSFQVNEILKYLKAREVKNYLNYIILDKNHKYPYLLDYENIDKDIKIIKADIINLKNTPKISARKIITELKKLLN
jgi:CofD-related protein of GAK system